MKIKEPLSPQNCQDVFQELTGEFSSSFEDGLNHRESMGTIKERNQLDHKGSHIEFENPELHGANKLNPAIAIEHENAVA